MLLQLLSYAGLTSTLVLYYRLKTQHPFKPAYVPNLAN